MRSRAVASMIFTLWLFVPAGAQTDRRSAGSAETDDYSIDNYELTVESQSGSSSVRVTMDITYRIRSGRKSTGFKYIGNYDAHGLSGADGDGKAIKTWVERQRETRINWSFPPAGPGTKRIILTFAVPGAIVNDSGDANKFEAEWAGVFKVPVKQAVYRFVFPDNVHRNVVCTPADYMARERNNCRSIEMTQAPFKNATFEMTFWPRIVDAKPTLASVGQSLSRATSNVGPVVGVAIALMLVILVVVLARKAHRLGGRSSSWWAGSSCAGGSSCSSSSSCGSSCGGGGCGGGCGG